MNASEDLNEPCADAEMGDDHFDGGGLCPACLAELTSGCNFCSSCAAPVTPLAAWAPFERVFAEGFIYRQAVASPRTLFVVIGAWLVFLPLFASGSAMLLWHCFVEHGDGLYLLEGGFITLIGTLGLYHVTQNYLQRPLSAIERSPEEPTS